MRASFWIAKRTVSSYVFRPMGWFLTAGFLAISGWYFAEKMNMEAHAGLMRSIFLLLEHLSILIVPLLAMPTIAGEHQDGTFETLLTAPVRTSDVVVGKFTGTFLFYLCLILSTLPYYLILRAYGPVDPGPVLTGYLGTVLAGATFLAIGMLFSALCRRQLLAALFTFLLIFALRLAPTFTMAMEPGPARDIFIYLHYRPHLEPFRQGVIDSRHVIYFVSSTLLFLGATIYEMKFRTWWS